MGARSDEALAKGYDRVHVLTVALEPGCGEVGSDFSVEVGPWTGANAGGAASG